MDSEPKLWLPTMPSDMRVARLTYHLHRKTILKIQKLVGKPVLQEIPYLRGGDLKMTLNAQIPKKKKKEIAAENGTYDPDIKDLPPIFSASLWYESEDSVYQTDDVRLETKIFVSDDLTAEIISELKQCYRRTVADALISGFVRDNPLLRTVIPADEDDSSDQKVEEPQSDTLSFIEEMHREELANVVWSLLKVRDEMIAGTFGVRPSMPAYGTDLLYKNEIVEGRKRKRRRK